MPKSFHRAPGMHCCCSNSESSDFQCFSSAVSVVFFIARRQSHQCPLWRDAHCSSSLSRASHGHLDGHHCRWRRVSPMPATSAVAEPPVATNRSQHQLPAQSSTAQATWSLRVAVLLPVHAAAPSPWPEQHRACSLPPTSPVSLSVENVEYHPRQSKLST